MSAKTGEGVSEAMTSICAMLGSFKAKRKVKRTKASPPNTSAAKKTKVVIPKRKVEAVKAPVNAPLLVEGSSTIDYSAIDFSESFRKIALFYQGAVYATGELPPPTHRHGPPQFRSASARNRRPQVNDDSLPVTCYPPRMSLSRERLKNTTAAVPLLYTEKMLAKKSSQSSVLSTGSVTGVSSCIVNKNDGSQTDSEAAAPLVESVFKNNHNSRSSRVKRTSRASRINRYFSMLFTRKRR